jgi:hypothetical protein
MVSDLKPISQDNDLVKFADDMSLLVPENTDCDISLEFDAIKNWAVLNRLTINLSKTKELVFRRPRPSKFISPPCLTGIERVVLAKFLDVYLKDNLSFSKHISFIVTQCSQRMFLLRALRNRGLPSTALEAIFNALVVSRIIYAVSAWGGFASASDVQRVDCILKKCKKFGYATRDYCFDDLLYRADHKLFRAAQSSSHCLHHLMPAIRDTAAVLRDRGHPFILPVCNYEVFKRSFITRSVYKFM